MRGVTYLSCHFVNKKSKTRHLYFLREPRYAWLKDMLLVVGHRMDYETGTIGQFMVLQHDQIVKQSYVKRYERDGQKAYEKLDVPPVPTGIERGITEIWGPDNYIMNHPHNIN